MGSHRFSRPRVVGFLTAGILLGSYPVVSAGMAPAGAASAQVELATPQPMIHNVIATATSEFAVSLTAGVPVNFRTTGITGTEDPVLHLFSGSRQVAFADGGGGGTAAYLTHTPATSGSYVLMVRSRTPASYGLADVLMNGAAWRQNVIFAGGQTTMADLRSGEQLRTTLVPHGVVGPHRLYVLGTDGVSATGRAVGSGSTGGASYTMPTARTSAVVVVGSPPGPLGALVRVNRNDAGMFGHDSDGDGVGSELESKIGTCSSLSGTVAGGFNCALATDPADTDGDGISDGWEYFGTATQTLARWGADPRHKDLFVEVDFEMACPDDVAKRMDPVQARKFADYYEDRIGAPTAAALASHAATLRNPDGRPGIEVHADTGVAPATPADATTYGNWGGYTAVPRANPTSTECKGANYEEAWKTYMSSARRGIFRYVLGHDRSAASSGFGFAIHGPLTNAVTLAHESGHGMNLGHSGPAYATGDVDPNCKPNYQSLMNYAYSYDNRGFGDGTGGTPLNNARLTEARAASTSDVGYLDALEKAFGYWVDRTTGDVDWNRDGVIAPAGTTVRAYANYRPGNSCEYTRYSQSQVPGGAISELSPAIERLNQRAYAFWVSPSGALRYAHTDSEWLCPTPSKQACATWSTPQTHGLPGGRGVDALRLDSPNSLLVLSVDGSGRLWHSRLTTDINKAETWTVPAQLPVASPVVGEPSVARRGLCTVYLTYKTSGHELRHRRWTCSGGWEAEQISLTDAGARIVLPSYASPGTVGGYLPSRPGSATVVGAFARSTGSLQLWRLDETLGRWIATADLKSDTGPTEGRPAMAWVPTTPNAPTKGRLYLMWIKHNLNTEAGREVMMAMSYTKVTRDPAGALVKVPQVGLNARFDNASYYAFGIDLLFQPGYDMNLISLTSRSSLDGPQAIEVRPKADGINDFTYINYNDWVTLRTQLCRKVINPGGLGPNEVTCP